MKPETVRFVDMMENLAVMYDGKKEVFRFYADNSVVIKNIRLDKDFCKKFLVYDDRKVELDCEDKNFYGIVKKVENGVIKEYYEDVYVVKQGEEILYLIGYPPEDDSWQEWVKDKDGEDVLFVLEKGKYYVV